MVFHMCISCAYTLCMIFCLCERYFLRHKLPLVHHTITSSHSIHDKFEDKPSQSLLTISVVTAGRDIGSSFPIPLTLQCKNYTVRSAPDSFFD